MVMWCYGGAVAALIILLMIMLATKRKLGIHFTKIEAENLVNVLINIEMIGSELEGKV